MLAALITNHLSCRKSEISFIEKKNHTIGQQVVQANLKDSYYSKLCNALKTGYPIEKMNLYYFSDFSIDLKNCIWQFCQLWIPEGWNLLVIREIHYHIVSGHLGCQKTISLLAYNHYWSKMKDIVNCYISNWHTYSMLKFLKINIIVD